MPERQDPTAEPGRTQVGTYRFRSLLATGALGDVYLAEQLAPRRTVALRLINPELSSQPDFLERYSRISQAVTQLRHPSIIAVYEVGSDAGWDYAAMHYVDGETLGAFLEREGPLSVQRARRVLAGVASALDAAAAAGIAHLGLNPDRVLVSVTRRTEHAALGGFGIVDPSGGREPSEFTAPEQLRSGQAGPPADVYAFGRLLSQALSDDLSPEADAALARATATDPAERWDSAGQLLQALSDTEATASSLSPEAGSSERDRLVGSWQQMSSTADDNGTAAAPQEEAVGEYDVPPELEPRVEDLQPASETISSPIPETTSSPVPETTASPIPEPEAPADPDAPAEPEGIGGADSQGPDEPDTKTSRPGRGGRRMGAIAAIIVLLLAAGGVAAAILAGDDEDGGTTSNAADTPSERPEPEPEPATPAPTTDGGVLDGWPEDRDGFTVVTFISPDDRAGAVAKAREAIDAGFEAGVLRSDDHTTVPPGFFVGFVGTYDTRAEAEVARARVEALGLARSPYVRPIDAPS